MGFHVEIEKIVVSIYRHMKVKNAKTVISTGKYSVKDTRRLLKRLRWIGAENGLKAMVIPVGGHDSGIVIICMTIALAHQGNSLIAKKHGLRRVQRGSS